MARNMGSKIALGRIESYLKRNLVHTIEQMKTNRRADLEIHSVKPTDKWMNGQQDGRIDRRTDMSE